MGRQLDRIGNTPLVQYRGAVLNGNRIWIKEEFRNPFGSHYDRVYKALWQRYEEEGIIKPGMSILETTSGSAGVSFAGIGRILGYRCAVAMPGGGEKAREEAIKNEGAELILTDSTKYVSGFPEFLRDYLKKNPHVFFMNHSMGRKGVSNATTLEALAGIALEIQAEINPVDIFIPAIGNGSSVLGPGRVLYPKTTVIAFETFQSAVGYEMLYPGRYEQKYRIPPGSLPRHRLPGTSFQGIDFPHIRDAIKDEGIVQTIWLVSDAKTDTQYRERTGKEIPIGIPRWDNVQSRPYGKTTRAGLSVALLVSRMVHEKNIVIIGYDHEDRYDDND